MTIPDAPSDLRPNPDHPLLKRHLQFIALCGIPGGGKSTYAKHLLATIPNSVIISPDDLRFELTGDISDQSKNGFIFNTLLPVRVNGAHALGKHVIYDACSYSRRARCGPLMHAQKTGYRVVCHVLKTPFDECVRRNNARERKVPLHVLERMNRLWEDPDPADESWVDEVIFVDNAPQSSQT